MSVIIVCNNCLSMVGFSQEKVCNGLLTAKDRFTLNSLDSLRWAA